MDAQFRKRFEGMKKPDGTPFLDPADAAKKQPPPKNAETAPKTTHGTPGMATPSDIKVNPNTAKPGEPSWQAPSGDPKNPLGDMVDWRLLDAIQEADKLAPAKREETMKKLLDHAVEHRHLKGDHIADARKDPTAFAAEKLKDWEALRARANQKPAPGTAGGP